VLNFQILIYHIECLEKLGIEVYTIDRFGKDISEEDCPICAYLFKLKRELESTDENSKFFG